MNPIKYKIENSLVELYKLQEITEKVCKYFYIDEKHIFNIHLCLDEILSNCIKHGYADGRKGEIEFEFRRDTRNLFLTVSDDADAYNPLDAPEPNLDEPIEKRKIGGLGVFFVKQITKSQHYSRIDGKNVFTVEFEI